MGGKPEYWEERYTRDPEPFDWYQRWAGLKDTFLEYVQPQHSLLMLGSGNARLSEEMYEDGYQKISNVDISNVVVKARQELQPDGWPGDGVSRVELRCCYRQGVLGRNP